MNLHANKVLLLIALLLVAGFISFSQNIKSSNITQQPVTRTLDAVKISGGIKIDGLLNEPAWSTAPKADKFVEFRPQIGRNETEATKSITYLLYSDEGIYFAGFCFESSKDSIATELKGRDGFGTNDYIGLIIDTYKDQLNAFEYFITPLNEQWDSKMSPNSNGRDEDFSWNAVWKSATVIQENGWSFEIFIPYGAIRFGSKSIQDWGINIVRFRQKTGQQTTWNPIDPTINGFLTQEGYWTGLNNIKPPIRLQLSPYFSVYSNHYPFNQPGVKNTTTLLNGGVDLKYGLNQAFTLDATLVPDFGQVQSDNQVLNLTPFEVRFNENRPFFTEGTELFSKGNLFYSRRIGGQPIHYYEAASRTNWNEKVIKNPSESKLLNAAKISGRIQSGLGIGLLNAVTQAQYATLENMTTKEMLKMQTNPLTNYNIFVLDQTLKHNSSVTFINTNVLRNGADYDANVFAGLFDMNDATNRWNISGKVSSSQRLNFMGDHKSSNGYNHLLSFGKVSGNLNFNIYQELMDKNYSNSDMGFFTNNNFLTHGFNLSYNWLTPKYWYNNIRLNLNSSMSHLFKALPGIDETYQFGMTNLNINAQTKKLWNIGGYLSYNSLSNDFYEPRKPGYYFTKNESVAVGLNVLSNPSKKYSFFMDVVTRRVLHFYNSQGVDFTASHTMRVSKKFSVSQTFKYQPRFNNIGFSAFDSNGNTIFARRKRNTIENLIDLKFGFTNKMGITYRMRHYVSTVENKEFFDLQLNGKLKHNSTFNLPVNQNVNYFNIDMVYTWQIAPGSFLNVVWKNAVYNYTNILERDYFRNLNNTLDANQNNNLSLKLIYFLDYLDLRRIKK